MISNSRRHISGETTCKVQSETRSILAALEKNLPPATLPVIFYIPIGFLLIDIRQTEMVTSENFYFSYFVLLAPIKGRIPLLCIQKHF